MNELYDLARRCGYQLTWEPSIQSWRAVAPSGDAMVLGSEEDVEQYLLARLPNHAGNP